MEQGDFITFDGTKIRYQISGQGPPMILANGLGGSFPAWKPVIDAFEDRYTIYTWDYRGLFGSERPSNMESVSVENHVNDLKAMIEFFNIGPAVFMGWSYGGQILVSAYEQFPHLFKGIIFHNALISPATDGFPLSEIVKPLFSQMTTFWKPTWSILSPLADKAIKSKIFMGLVKSIGLIGKNLDQTIFLEIASEFVKLDHQVFAKTIQASQLYDGSHVLPTIKIPVLLLGGTRDFIVLPSTSRGIASKIPNCKMVLVPKTSHYTILEASEIVISEIEIYLNETIEKESINVNR
jgi:pimeloyl-ACP methyl ester carboxylesterase